VIEVLNLADLRGSVFRDGRLQLVCGDADAVVSDADPSVPPASTETATRVAPASRLFSISSLTTLAGRSTTSPAAMRWTVRSSNRSMFGGSIATLRSDERALEPLVVVGDARLTVCQSAGLLINRIAVARASERPAGRRVVRDRRSL